MNDAITRFPTSRVSIDDAEYLAAQQAGAQYLLHLNPDRLLYPFDTVISQLGGNRP